HELIRTRFDRPDIGELAEFAKKALPANPDNGQLTEAIINILVYHERFNLGQSIFSPETATPEQLKSPHFHAGIATFLQKDDVKAAVEHARIAAENSEKWEYVLSYGELLLRQRMIGEAFEAIERAEVMVETMRADSQKTAV